MSRQRDGFRTVAYFVNWAIYGRNHNPQDLPADKLTHVLYAFANVKPDSGEVYLTDTWSDLEKHYPTDTWNEPTPTPNIYGCLKQLALLKRRNRNLKTLLSIGGWTYSPNFAPASSTAAGIARFAKTAVQILKDCGFDGLDIDWEYPQNATEAANCVALLQATRAELDTYAQAQHLPTSSLLLTVACPAGPANFRNLHITQMDRYLDFWNLMAYDFAGAWDTRAAHQANVFPSSSSPAATPFSALAAVRHYIAQGVAASKIVLGCPLYGRAFVGTQGPGHAFTGGVGPGSWEQGIWDWKVLPLPCESGMGTATCRVHVDEEVMASWSYDAAARTMVSFDAESIVRQKAEWVVREGLGGIMWWESSADRRVGEGSAIEMVAGVFGKRLEEARNVIAYPESKYSNLRNGFPND